MKRSMTIAAAMVLVVAAGCQTVPEDAFRLTESTLELREMQTRGFDDVDESDILSASIGVLQDMGYVVDDVEPELGVLAASKKVDATNTGELVALYALEIASCAFIGCGDYASAAKDEDLIKVTLVVKPGPPEVSKYFVRVTMQHVLKNKAGLVAAQETIDDPETYQQLFDKLSRSLFLEQAET